MFSFMFKWANKYEAMFIDSQSFIWVSFFVVLNMIAHLFRNTLLNFRVCASERKQHNSKSKSPYWFQFQFNFITKEEPLHTRWENKLIWLIIKANIWWYLWTNGFRYWYNSCLQNFFVKQHITKTSSLFAFLLLALACH